jgi:hypothetical protein
MLVSTCNITLILKALLTPEAKKPPKGAIKEAKEATKIEWKNIGLR